MDTKLTSIASREGFGYERYETSEFQKLVYNNFTKLFDFSKSTEDCLVLNAKESIENLHSKIIEHVNKLNETNGFTINDIKRLW